MAEIQGARTHRRGSSRLNRAPLTPIPTPTLAPAPERVAFPKRGHDPLAIHIAAKVGAMHALLEVDYDPEIALPQLIEVLAEAEALVHYVADQLTLRQLA